MAPPRELIDLIDLGESEKKLQVQERKDAFQFPMSVAFRVVRGCRAAAIIHTDMTARQKVFTSNNACAGSEPKKE